MAIAVITGASSGIGAAYAERLAARGYELMLVARSGEKMAALAERLRAAHGTKAEVVAADLTDGSDLAGVGARLRGMAVDVLVNNAGANLTGGVAAVEAGQLEWLLKLNVTAPTLLAHAVLPGMAARGAGAVVNIGSVLGLAPERIPGIYGATKAYMLAFSQSLAKEFGEKGVYVQAVLPAATRTEIWARSGRDVGSIPNLMEVGDLVDAALVGFDRREAVTIPPLPEVEPWEAFEAARAALAPGFGNAKPGTRYLG